MITTIDGTSSSGNSSGSPALHLQWATILHNTAEYSHAVRLREDVLRKPIGLTFTEAEIAAEKDWIHIAAYLEGELCATSALAPESNEVAKVCRVAVRSDLQGKGIGTRMMRYMERCATDKGFKKLYLHARDTSIPFYLKSHYVAEGDWFEEDTVPHKKLRKIL